MLSWKWSDSRRSLDVFWLLFAAVPAPLYMMWHVLVVDRQVHLANPGPRGSSSVVTDLDGAARLAYILSAMSTPWSESAHISSPSGAGIWRIETATQSIQVVALWILARVADSMFAANLLIFSGWVATGIVTFLIVRTLGGSRIAGGAATLVIQTLPSTRLMAANFTSYVWLAVPLLVVFSILRWEHQRSVKSAILVCLALAANVFFDPYWAYFSLFILVIYSTTLTMRSILRQAARRDLVDHVTFLVLGILGFLFAYLLPEVISRSSNSREIEVATWTDARNSALSLEAWFASDVMGVGPLLSVMFLVALLSIVICRWDRLYVPVIVAVVMTVVSLRFVVPLTTYELVPSSFLRHFMPGVRFFDRASLIGTALLVIATAVAVEKLIKRSTQLINVRVSLAAAFLVAALGINGLVQPASTRSYHDWAPIRRVLDGSPDSRLVALPFTRRGRDWIEQASFRTPLVNDYVRPVNDPEIILQASHGESFLAAALLKLGASHALVVDSEFSRLFDYQLTRPRFIPLQTIALNGFGEGEDFVAVLYKIAVLAEDVVCGDCSVGPHLIPNIRVTGDLVYPPDTGAAGNRWWWVGEGRIGLNLSSLPLPTRVRAKTSWTVRLSIAPCVSEVQVSVDTDGETKVIQLNAENQTAEFQVSLDQSLNGLVNLRGAGRPCVPPGDNRTMLYQISAVSD